MVKRAILLSALVVAIELVVLWISFQISELNEVKYALASRYSARVSLVIFESALIWMAWSGLMKIYSKESTRQVYVLLLFLFTVNHIMHFFFLYANHAVNGLVLFTPRTMGGMFGYLVLILLPIAIWNRKQLTSPLYAGILMAVFFLDVIAFISYLGRWKKDLPMASSKETYIGIMMVMGMILIMNVYRIFAEQKVTVETTED